MCFGAPDYGAGRMRRSQQEQEARTLATLERIATSFGGYNKGFYEKRAKDFVRANMPTLQEQFKTAGENLGFATANRGLQGSLAEEKLGSALQKDFTRAKMDLVDAARAKAQGLEREVEGQRSQLTGLVQQAVDPAATAQSALYAATQFNAPSIAQPVADAFGNWANAYLAANLSRNNPSVGATFSQLPYPETAVGTGYGASGEQSHNTYRLPTNYTLR